MAQLQNDKYYTQPEIAKRLVIKFEEIIGLENITEYLEPSAGNGSFLPFLRKPTLAYDLYPENDVIKRQDYLELILPYKNGRAVIGNPPFGHRNTLATKFFKKSIQICDFIGFILPISQLDNNQKMYEFDLIYSEDLGKTDYSSIKLHCCFNVYKRPENGFNSSPKDWSLKDVEVFEYRRGSDDVLPARFDFAMCTWGNGSCGKIPKFAGQYAQEHYLVIKNESLRDEIMKICNETDWRHLNGSVSSAKLQTWRIYKHIGQNVIGIQ